MSKNILILLASRGRGGVEKRFINYVSYIANNQSNDKYAFFVNRNILLDSEYSTLNQSQNVKLITYKSIKLGNLRRINTSLNIILFYLKVLFLQKKIHFDVVHFSTFTALHTFKLFKGSRKLVSVYTGHEALLNFKLNHKIFQNTIGSAYYDCLSPSIKDQLIKTTSIKKDNVYTSPGSFIDLKDTQVENDKKENLMLYVGSLIDPKGLDLLTALLENWHKINEDYKLLILGKGPGSNQIIEKINKYGLEGQVELSYTTTPKKYLRKSKIFLTLQVEDNYPSQSLLEAMACKNAIVATDVGLTHKLVDDSNGVRIDRSTESLIEAINMMIAKIKNDFSLFENSRQKILESQNVEQFHGYISRVYSEITKE